jgi:hypothetical protein
VGQQQLLLIIVGVIITGIAVAVGITIFQSNAAGQNRDMVWNDLNELGARALQYYRKPRAIGGGGSSFVGFILTGKELENDNGVYSVVGSASTTEVRILGVGTETGYDQEKPVTLTVIVSSDSMSIEISTIN